MKQPKFGPIFLAFGLFLICMIPFVLYVNHQTDQIVRVDNLAANLDDRKYDGLVVEEKALSSNQFFYMFDSSNLKYSDCVSNLFKGQEGFIPYFVGGDGIKSINHILKMVDLNNSIRNRKIVFFVEPKYFITDNPHSYNIGRGFSTLHVYHFLLKSHINRKLKVEIAKNLLKSGKFYRDPVLLCLLSNSSKKHPNIIIQELIKPVGYGILALLEQIDRINVYQLINSQHATVMKALPRSALNWNELLGQAEKDGQKACQSNDFSIDEVHFNNIKTSLNSFRNKDRNKKYLCLGELNDFQLFMDVCKEFNVKPLFIIEPVNGSWNDYTGLPQKVRCQFDAQITQMIQKAGFQYADFSNHAYEKYFFLDTQHIGWKGWVYIDQAMERFYHQ